jgi:hypothetical protein
MTNHEEHDAPTESFWAGSVSWAQLMIALVTMLAGGAAFLMATERRITLLEERQSYVLRTIASHEAEMVSLRREILTKLETMASDINLLRLELAKHQAAMNGNAGR